METHLEKKKRKKKRIGFLSENVFFSTLTSAKLVQNVIVLAPTRENVHSGMCAEQRLRSDHGFRWARALDNQGLRVSVGGRQTKI